MRKTLENGNSSELYRKIAALPLAPAAREKALATLEIAERLVDAITKPTAARKPAVLMGTAREA